MVIKSLTILILLPFALQKTVDHTLFKPVEIHIHLYGYFSASLVALVVWMFYSHVH